MPSELDWVDASGNSGSCVQMARDGEFVVVRDSKDPDGPRLTFTLREAAVFLSGAKNGVFDSLLVTE